jgi:sulfate permease, SulP family
VFLNGLPGRLAEYHINLTIGTIVFALVLGLLDNKKFPAALAAGIIAGFALGGFNAGAFSIGPPPIQVVSPSLYDFWTAFVMLILPQIPLTIGNACVGTAGTCCTLFPQSPSLSKSRAGKFALTMGIANFPAGFFGAVPMCHGTGSLAAHYRFGVRTGGAPVMIGALFVVMALAFGEFGFAVLALIPNSVLGVLLVFAGLELCPLVRSLKGKGEYFVALLITGIALAVPNMAWAFGIGIAVDLFTRKMRKKYESRKICLKRCGQRRKHRPHRCRKSHLSYCLTYSASL